MIAKNDLKYLVKQRVVGAARDLSFAFSRSPVNTDGWESRMLLINMNALGDIALFTSVLKHYKKAFPGKKIYLLVRADLGLGQDSIGGLVDEIVTIDHRKFGLDPLYAVRFINRLRKTGFYKVIDQGPSVSELIARIISVSLGAREVYGYEGVGVQYQTPIDYAMSDAIRFCRKKIFPRYTKLIPSIDKESDLHPLLKNYTCHLIAIYEGVTGRSESDYAPELHADPSARRSVEGILRDHKIASRSYCVLTLGASSPTRRWPVERFAEAAKELEARRIPIVLVGTAGEAALASEFKRRYSGETADLVGKLSLPELIALITDSLFVFTNDSGPVHIAVACRAPSLCIVGAGNPGLYSRYGYRGANLWVYDENVPCAFDNWRCALNLPPGTLSPCITGISVPMVREKMLGLLETVYDAKSAKRKDLASAFQTQF